MDTEREAILSRLVDVRSRTLALVEPLADEDWRRQPLAIVSPVVWDLAHVANFEEIWCLRRLGAATSFSTAQDRMLDAIATPRPVRGSLDLPSRESCLSHLARVRAAVLERLERADLDGPDPLVARGYAWELSCQHEEQHQETILAALALLEPGRYRPPRRARERLAPVPRPASVLVRGGVAVVGSGGRARPHFDGGNEEFAYDNERPAHGVKLRSFEIDTVPATQGDLLAFVEDDGYSRRELWSSEGWSWLEKEAIDLPLGWEREPGGRVLVSWFDRVERLEPDVPACRLSWYEAEAYARWRGKRLPTEAEWEKAASWDPAFGCRRARPWGNAPWTEARADLDQLGFGPTPVGTRPLGASPYGALDLLGGVWEWTASDFGPYPGFTPFPYDEYSLVHMERGLKVLRGGSWATRPAVARTSFRNWDLPARRQIFAGVRLARDAA